MKPFKSRHLGIGGYDDEGGPARYFFCAKASKRERQGNHHPTVKPLMLCQHLATLILPPAGFRKLLVPYSGSGSEMVGALQAGWDYVVGIEREAEYVEIAKGRLASLDAA